jgi:hypothetical protein
VFVKKRENRNSFPFGLSERVEAHQTDFWKLPFLR